MPDQDPSTVPSGEMSSAWGFHILQELRRMEDKADAKIDGLEARMDAKIDGLEARMDAKIDGLETKMDALETRMSTAIKDLDTKMETKFEAARRETDQKIDNLRYWSWGTIIVVLVAAVTLFLTGRP